MSHDAKTRIGILLVISMLLSGCTGEVVEEPHIADPIYPVSQTPKYEI